MTAYLGFPATGVSLVGGPSFVYSSGQGGYFAAPVFTVGSSTVVGQGLPQVTPMTRVTGTMNDIWSSYGTGDGMVFGTSAAYGDGTSMHHVPTEVLQAGITANQAAAQQFTYGGGFSVPQFAQVHGPQTSKPTVLSSARLAPQSDGISSVPYVKKVNSTGQVYLEITTSRGVFNPTLSRTGTDILNVTDNGRQLTIYYANRSTQTVSA